MSIHQPPHPEHNFVLFTLNNPVSIEESVKQIWEQLMSEHSQIKQDYQEEKISRAEWRSYLDSHAVLSDSYKQFLSLYHELGDEPGFVTKMHYYEKEGEVTAFEYVIVCDEAYGQKPFVFNFIGVMHDYQRQGLGYQLLGLEIEYLKSLSIKEFKVGVWEGSEALYAKRKREVGDIDYVVDTENREILVTLK